MTYNDYRLLIKVTRKERDAIERAANHCLAYVCREDTGEPWERETADDVLGDVTDSLRRWAELSYAVLLLAEEWRAGGRTGRMPPPARQTKQERSIEARQAPVYTEADVARALDMLSAGMTRAHVAREMGCRKRTLDYWIRKRAA